MSHTFTNLLAHVIFSTKDRRPFIEGELKPRLLAYLGGIVRELRGTALVCNGPADHVHLLTSLPGTAAMSDAIRIIKTNSSRWIHQTWADRGDFAWQTGYGAFSVSQSNVQSVREYILGQEEHHKAVTFQQEFIAFLKRHEIPYDERYIWE